MSNVNVESWRMTLRIGLSALARLLDMLCDWALAAQLPGTRRSLYAVRKEVWKILEDFGKAVANTNSNSCSRDDLDPRSSNSSSRSKRPSGGPAPPAKRAAEESPSGTNTKFEEQAP